MKKKRFIEKVRLVDRIFSGEINDASQKSTIRDIMQVKIKGRRITHWLRNFPD